MNVINSDNMDFPLSKIAKNGNYRYRIYGIGEVAASYFHKLITINVECIDYFINSMGEKTRNFNKKVLLPNELTDL